MLRFFARIPPFVLKISDLIVGKRLEPIKNLKKVLNRSVGRKNTSCRKKHFLKFYNGLRFYMFEPTIIPNSIQILYSYMPILVLPVGSLIQKLIRTITNLCF